MPFLGGGYGTGASFVEQIALIPHAKHYSPPSKKPSITHSMPAKKPASEIAGIHE